jgi:hypothetical protein
MGNAGRVVVAVVADLVIGGFGYLLFTSTMDNVSKAFGALACLVILTAVTNHAVGDKPKSD